MKSCDIYFVENYLKLCLLGKILIEDRKELIFRVSNKF